MTTWSAHARNIPMWCHGACHSFQSVFSQLFLTHRGQDKMIVYLQTTFSNSISDMKIAAFHCSLFLCTKGPINSKSRLIQVMTWRQCDAKPLPETFMIRAIDAYTRPTRPQCVSNRVSLLLPLLLFINSSPPSTAYMRQLTGSSLVQVMACRLFGAKPLSEPILEYC